MKGDYLYIGMTLDNPILRWSNSIIKGGSFFNAMEQVDAQFAYLDIPVIHISVECTEILTSEAPKTDWKTITCYAEHLIHVKFSINSHIFKNRHEIISNTLRTAPLRCNYKWAKNMSDRIFSLMKVELNRSKYLTK